MVAMIVREATRGDGILRRAKYSDCGLYRYDLLWRWKTGAPLFVAWMLNPSTATEEELDPTVKGINARARAGNFGGFRIINLFAYRHPDPWAMRAVEEPVGPDNDAVIQDVLAQSVEQGDLVVCGWGEHGAHRGRAGDVVVLAAPSNVRLHAFRLNKDGAPTHPLYLAHALTPTPWTPPQH